METEEKKPEGARYPLAYDANGDPLIVPADAVAWRVRRGGGKRGRPRNVFASNGRQLEIPIAATIDELVNEGCGAGNYLLYPIDVQGRALPGAFAVTEIQEDGEEEPGDEKSTANAANELTALGHALATVRSQSEALARALEATTRGYGPIHPPSLVTEPLTLSPPVSPEAKAAQVMDYMSIAKMVLDVLRGAGIGVPTPAATGGA